MHKINADGTVLNFAQRHSNTQPACWLKTSTAMCCMAAPCHLREAENSPRHHLRFRPMWKNMLAVRSTGSFRHVDKSERTQSLEKVYACRKDSMASCLHKINADGTVWNFVQRDSNTQPACWLKTSTAMCWMAAPCHLCEAENSPRHHLHFRPMWKNMLAVRSTSSFRHVDKSERTQSLEKVYACRKDSMASCLLSHV